MIGLSIPYRLGHPASVERDSYIAPDPTCQARNRDSGRNVKIWIQGEGVFEYNLLVDDVTAILTGASN